MLCVLGACTLVVRCSLVCGRLRCIKGGAQDELPTDAEMEADAREELSCIAGVDVYSILQQDDAAVCSWAEGVLLDALTWIASGKEGESLVDLAARVLWMRSVPEDQQEHMPEAKLLEWFAPEEVRIGTEFTARVPRFITSMQKYREPKSQLTPVDPDDLPF